MSQQPTLRLNRANLQHSNILAELHTACFPRGWSSAEFDSFFERDGIISFIAECDDEPIGFVFCWVVAGECELLSLAVLEPWRKQGIATELLNEAIRWCKTQDASVMHLEVAVSNKAAQELYKLQGFEMVSRRKDYYHYPDGTCEDAVTMRCDL